MSRFTSGFMQGGSGGSGDSEPEADDYTPQEWLRLRDARKAMAQQRKDEKNPNLPKDRVQRNGEIRRRELGKQLKKMGGTPDSIRRIT